jgi:hypothetical protein
MMLVSARFSRAAFGSAEGLLAICKAGGFNLPQ